MPVSQQQMFAVDLEYGRFTALPFGNNGDAWKIELEPGCTFNVCAETVGPLIELLQACADSAARA